MATRILESRGNTACDMLDLLVCGLRNPSERSMAMLAGYFDDSGSERLGPVFILAGYVAPVEAWKRFSIEWANALDQEPRLEYFKMSQANSRRCQFWGWPEDERDKRLILLSDIILHNVSWGVTCALFWEDFYRIKAEHPSLPIVPYDFLFHGVIAAASNHVLQKKIGKKIDFIFDEQQGAGARATLSLQAVLRTMKPQAAAVIGGAPIHRDEKEFLPLQAADLIAWQTRRFVYENEGDLEAEELQVNSSIAKKLEKIPTIYNTYGLDRLRKIAEAFEYVQSVSSDPHSFSQTLAKPFDAWRKQ